MISCEDADLVIRDMEETDTALLSAAFNAQG